MRRLMRKERLAGCIDDFFGDLCIDVLGSLVNHFSYCTTIYISIIKRFVYYNTERFLIFTPLAKKSTRISYYSTSIPTLFSYSTEYLAFKIRFD